MSLTERLLGQIWRVKPEIFPVEIDAAILVLLLAFLFGSRTRRLSAMFASVAHRRWTACSLIALFVLGARLALLPIVPVPEPTIRDEFSHLLGAQTYASGRLANPTHPRWMHFEAPYTIQTPTFVSAYPPGQALSMAPAIALGISPWWAVWLITGFTCGALCWALQGWLPPKWAFFAAIVAALRYGILSYWMNSYWGGSLAALGGALALGALPRLSRSGPAMAVCFAAGLVIVVVARPYEGLLLSTAIGAAVLWSTFRYRNKLPRLRLPNLWKRQLVVPAVLVVSAGAGGMLYYCWRTTGAFELPYNVFIREYWPARHFIPMAPPPERTYRHDVFNAFAGSFRREHEVARSLPGWLERNAERAIHWWMFYCGPLLTLPLLLGFRTFRDRKTMPLLVAALVFGAGLSVEVPKMAHYASPFTAAWLVIWTRSARHASVSRYGRGVVRLVPIMLAALLVYRVATLLAKPAVAPAELHPYQVTNWCCVPTGIRRAELERQFERLGGRHLVFFKTSAEKLIYYDWVYNKPDVDASQIVWARAMSEADDASLCAYYPERRAWLVDATDEEKPVVRRYCENVGLVEEE